MMKQERILLVDDEPKLLSSFQRHFRREYDIHTARSGDEALAAIERDGPFAVVVSDQRMPGMSGVDLFRKLRDLGDRSARIMLTGSMDQAIAVAAVNHGGVFRFHNKGDGLSDLEKSVADGITHYKTELDRNAAAAETPPHTIRDTFPRDVAAALDSRQFHVCYQPQVDPRCGTVVGAEALLRWTHPSLGRISPEDFVPVLEQTGEITRVGGWILEQACRRLADLRRRGFGVPRISVNLSAHQLLQDDLVAAVESALLKTGVEPQSLELELTESAAIDYGPETSRRLDDLKALGVLLAIDDFGTGYSTFANLTRYPLDRLKIDKSLVEDIDRNDQRRAVVGTIIELCRQLGLSVTVEGIERQSQLDAVRELGCDEVQGFLFSPPLAPNALATYLRNGCAGGFATR